MSDVVIWARHSTDGDKLALDNPLFKVPAGVAMDTLYAMERRAMGYVTTFADGRTDKDLIRGGQLQMSFMFQLSEIEGIMRRLGMRQGLGGLLWATEHYNADALMGIDLLLQPICKDLDVFERIFKLLQSERWGVNRVDIFDWRTGKKWALERRNGKAKYVGPMLRIVPFYLD